jgi:predicted transcriptional regulator
MTAPDIEQDIERTREHLGDTVDELAARADVAARARARAAEVKARAAEVSGRIRRSEQVRRRWPAAVAAGLLVAGSAVLWRRRRAR